MIYSGDIKGNLIINTRDDVSGVTSVGGYVLYESPGTITLPLCTSVGGYVLNHSKGTIDLPACVSVGGSVANHSTGKITLPNCTTMFGVAGRVIAVSQYWLWAGENGLFYASCMNGLTRDQALAHWNRTDERAVAFTKAIRECAL